MQLILTDRPFNTRRLARDGHFAYDLLSAADARNFAELARVLLRPGGHVLIFCSWEQAPMWVSQLRAVEDVGDDGRRLAAFLVDSHPLLAIRAVHTQNRGVRTNTALANEADLVVGSTRAGADAAAAHVMVNHQTFNAVPSRFRAFDNVIDNVRDVPACEIVPAADGSGRYMRPEQKVAALLVELIQRFSQPGDIVVDPFAGTCSTAAAALSAPCGQHRRVIVSDADPEVITAGLERLRRIFRDQVVLGAFVRHLGEAHSQICAAAQELQAIGNADGACGAAHGGGVACAARGPSPTVGRATTSTTTTTATSSARLSAPPAEGLPVHSARPRDLLLFLANRLGQAADETCTALGTTAHPRAPQSGRDVAASVAQLGGVALDRWPLPLRCALATEDTQELRDHSAAASGVFFAHSQVAGGNAGLGVFGARPLASGTLVGPFFGALMYQNFGRVSSRSARYAQDVLGGHAPSIAEFRERALKLMDVRVEASESSRVSTSTTSGRSHPRGYDVWVSPAPYCVAGFVNDPRAASPTDRTVMDAVPAAERPRSNVRLQVRVECGVVDPDLLVDPRFCCLYTTTDVPVGQEQLLNYGKQYTFYRADACGGAHLAASVRRVGGPASISGSTTPHTFAPSAA